MNRSQRKCLAVSACLHLGLLATVFLVSAFRPAAPPAMEFHPIDFTPLVTTIEKMSGGGNPQGQVPQPAQQQPPQPQPKPAPQKPPEPIPPEPPVRHSEPKPETDSLTPWTRPTHKQPEIDVSHPIVRERTRPKRQDEDNRAEETAEERAAAKLRQRLAGEFTRIQTQLGSSRSGSVSLEFKGPGGGGLPYANFYDAVYTIYRQEWIIPDGATESDATTTAEVTIGRDGTVIRSRILRYSGNAAVDASVQSTLDRVRNVPALPPGSEESRITITINFNAKALGKSASG